MNRAALEHILRAASAIANEREFIVIGSQAILGQYPSAPESLLMSIEADVYPRYAPERSDVGGPGGESCRAFFCASAHAACGMWRGQGDSV